MGLNVKTVSVLLATVTCLAACTSEQQSKLSEKLDSTVALIENRPKTYEEVTAHSLDITNTLDKLKADSQKDSRDGNEITVITLYKPECKTCRKMEKAILEEYADAFSSKSLKVTTLFVDITNGVPESLTNALPLDTLAGQKTPYLLVLRSDVSIGAGEEQRFVPIVKGRLTNEEILKEAVQTMVSFAKMDANQLPDLVDLSREQ